MRLGTIYYNNHSIEIHNNPFGTETIYYDGILMSKISSFRGGFHKFEVKESGEWVTYVVLLKLTMQGVSFDVYRDEEPIMLGAA